MNGHTLELLEFDAIRRLVAGYASSALGKDAALHLEPSADPAAVRQRQALTTEMTEALVARLSPPLGGIPDVRPLVRRAQVGAALEAAELADLASVLRSIADIDRWLARIGDQFPRLGALRSSVGEFGGVASSISSALDERGKVLDTASRRLSALRADVGRLEQRIQDTLRSMLRSPEIRRILRFPNYTMVGHHYVLPISADHRGELEGSVHRTSASNETVYVEPRAIADHSAQLSYVRAKEAKEIRRILRWLSAQIGHVAPQLLATLETIAAIDLVLASARYSLDYNMSPPDLNTEGRVHLRSARHPILESILRARAEARAKAATSPPPTDDTDTTPDTATPSAPSTGRAESVVPIDLHLGLQFRMLIITGPNTGGKTVALKTLGLLALMAQCGLHIPAAQGSQLAVFDDILADIGDEQSLQQSLSTFSSHVRRISEILQSTTDRSLVLLDELGAGTDPAEGAALGRAILDEIDGLGPVAMVTTHLGNLKTYAFTNARAQNAAVEFDIESLRPLYRLQIGEIGASNALAIARRLELASHVVDRAASYLAEQSSESRGADWQALEKLRHEAEQSRQQALELQAEAQRTRDALSQRLTDLQNQGVQEAQLEEARARLQPGDRVVVPRFGYDRPGRVVKIDPRKRLAQVAIGQMKWDVPVAELIPQVARIPAAADTPKPRSARPSTPAGPGIDDYSVED